MASAIDPSKPEDGAPADKGVLRANLAAAKTELEHGGFAEGLTPSRYGPPASARVTDHLAAIDSALDGLGGFTGLADTPPDYAAQGSRFVKVRADETGLEFVSVQAGGGGLTGWTDVKADHGAVGDGSTDDTTALQNALNSGASVVFLPEGTYRITSSLSVVPGTTVFGAGPGRTVIDATALPDQIDPAAIVCQGTTVTLPPLAAPIGEGDPEIVFSSSVEADVLENDAIGILDERDFSFMGFSAAKRDGGWINVLARNGSTVVCASGAPRNLPSARIPGGTVADLTAVRIDRRGLTLRGFSLDCRALGTWPNGVPERGIGITLRWLADPLIEDVHVRGAPTYGIDLDRCARARINRVRVHGLGPAWEGGRGMYGMICAGCAHTTISDSQIIGGRHALDFDCGGGEQPIRQIPGHDNLVHACVLESPADNAFMAPGSVVTWAMSWHESVYRCSVKLCTINGGIAFRGFGHLIQDNMIFMPDQEANLHAISGDHIGPRSGVSITGNYIRTHTSTEMIELDFDQCDATEDPGIVDISNNVLDDRSGGTAAIIAFTSGPPAGKCYVKIHDNIVVASTNRSFVNISSNDGDFVRVSIFDNQLPSTVSLGTVANATDWLARNMVGGHMTFANLPSANPGGSGRLWSDGGTLKIT